MKLKPEDVERVLKLREDGMKLDEIAAVLGVSRRRVLQVLKKKRINTPGRKKKELSPEIVNLIVDLKRRGYTIEEIRNYLAGIGVRVSRYKVWSTINEHRRRLLSEEIGRALKGWGSVIGIILLHLRAGDENFKLLLIVNLRECKIVKWRMERTLRLKEVIWLLDETLRWNTGKTLVVISRRPPLVPTRGPDNRLTKHLKNLGIPYMWITSRELVKIQKKVSRKLSREIDPQRPREWFERKGVNFVEGVCSSYLKRVWEVGKNGSA